MSSTLPAPPVLPIKSSNTRQRRPDPPATKPSHENDAKSDSESTETDDTTDTSESDAGSTNNEGKFIYLLLLYLCYLITN